MPWLLRTDWSVLPQRVWHHARRVRIWHAGLRVRSLLRHGPISITAATGGHQRSDCSAHSGAHSGTDAGSDRRAYRCSDCGADCGAYRCSDCSTHQCSDCGADCSAHECTHSGPTAAASRSAFSCAAFPECRPRLLDAVQQR